MTTYSEKVGIRNELHNRLEEITWLSGKVAVNAWRTDNSFPCALLTWQRDDPVLEQVNTGTYKHNLTCGIVFRNVLGDPVDYDIIVSGAGAIEDKIAQYASNYLSGNLGWEKAEITSVDYGYTSPGMATRVIGEASIVVTLTKEI